MVAPNANARSSFLSIFFRVFRILIQPVQRLFSLLFPSGDLDGLDPAVQAKAAEQFVAYLQSLSPAAPVSQAWSTLGFSAIKQEALQSNSLVLLYLHSPLHASSDSFCRNVLTNPDVCVYLSSILATGLSIHSAQGAYLQSTLQITEFPVILILQPRRNTLHVAGRLEGLGSMGQLFHTLRYLHQQHQQSLIQQETERLRRMQEEELRREQDAEYERALAADRERELQKQEELRIQEELAEAERQAELVKTNAIEEARKKILLEPASGGTKIRFCLPNGVKLNRKFESSQTVGDLKAFLRVHFEDESIEFGTIGLSTNFPRKSYNESGDEELTLEAAQLSPQAVLMVQDLDV